MHRDGELDRSKRSSRVAADTRASVDDELANFVGDLLQILNPKLPQIGGRIYL
jgi:hypothetical protein